MEQLTVTPPVKRCSKCGRELPLTEFYKKKDTKDGLQYYCKSCQNQERKEQTKKRKPLREHVLCTNEKFINLTPRELIADMRELITELKARGYSYEGKLTYTQEIKL